MELKLYIKIIKKNLLLIIVCVALSASLAYFISTKHGSGYKLEQAFFIKDTSPQATASAQSTLPQPYDFDSYYNQEKARNFTDTAAAIFQNPDFANSLNIGSARISAQKLSPQLIKITVISASLPDSQFALERAVFGFNQKMKDFNSLNPLEITPIGVALGPVLESISTPVALLAGVVFGLAASTFLIAIKTYFKL